MTLPLDRISKPQNVNLVAKGDLRIDDKNKYAGFVTVAIDIELDGKKYTVRRYFAENILPNKSPDALKQNQMVLAGMTEMVEKLVNIAIAYNLGRDKKNDPARTIKEIALERDKHTISRKIGQDGHDAKDLAVRVPRKYEEYSAAKNSEASRKTFNQKKFDALEYLRGEFPGQRPNASGTGPRVSFDKELAAADREDDEDEELDDTDRDSSAPDTSGKAAAGPEKKPEKKDEGPDAPGAPSAKAAAPEKKDSERADEPAKSSSAEEPPARPNEAAATGSSRPTAAQAPDRKEESERKEPSGDKRDAESSSLAAHPKAAEGRGDRSEARKSGSEEPGGPSTSTSVDRKGGASTPEAAPRAPQRKPTSAAAPAASGADLRKTDSEKSGETAPTAQPRLPIIEGDAEVPQSALGSGRHPDATSSEPSKSFLRRRPDEFSEQNPTLYAPDSALASGGSDLSASGGTDVKDEKERLAQKQRDAALAAASASPTPKQELPVRVMNAESEKRSAGDRSGSAGSDLAPPPEEEAPVVDIEAAEKKEEALQASPAGSSNRVSADTERRLRELQKRREQTEAAQKRLAEKGQISRSNAFEAGDKYTQALKPVVETVLALEKLAESVRDPALITPEQTMEYIKLRTQLGKNIREARPLLANVEDAEAKRKELDSYEDRFAPLTLRQFIQQRDAGLSRPQESLFSNAMKKYIEFQRFTAQFNENSPISSENERDYARYRAESQKEFQKAESSLNKDDPKIEQIAKYKETLNPATLKEFIKQRTQHAGALSLNDVLREIEEQRDAEAASTSPRERSPAISPEKSDLAEAIGSVNAELKKAQPGSEASKLLRAKSDVYMKLLGLQLLRHRSLDQVSDEDEQKYQNLKRELAELAKSFDKSPETKSQIDAILSQHKNIFESPTLREIHQQHRDSIAQLKRFRQEQPAVSPDGSSKLAEDKILGDTGSTELHVVPVDDAESKQVQPESEKLRMLREKLDSVREKLNKLKEERISANRSTSPYMTHLETWDKFVSAAKPVIEATRDLVKLGETISDPNAITSEQNKKFSELKRIFTENIGAAEAALTKVDPLQVAEAIDFRETLRTSRELFAHPSLRSYVNELHKPEVAKNIPEPRARSPFLVAIDKFREFNNFARAFDEGSIITARDRAMYTTLRENSLEAFMKVKEGLPENDSKRSQIAEYEKVLEAKSLDDYIKKMVENAGPVERKSPEEMEAMLREIREQRKLESAQDVPPEGSITLEEEEILTVLPVEASLRVEDEARSREDSDLEALDKQLEQAGNLKREEEKKLAAEIEKEVNSFNKGLLELKNFLGVAVAKPNMDFEELTQFWKSINTAKQVISDSRSNLIKLSHKIDSDSEPTADKNIQEVNRKYLSLDKTFALSMDIINIAQRNKAIAEAHKELIALID